MGVAGTAELGGGNLLGRWSHFLENGSGLHLQVYYDHTHLSRPYAAVPAAPPYVLGFPASALVDNLDTYDVDFQHSLHWDSHKLVWGLGYRYTHQSDTNEGIVRFSPTALQQNLVSGFVQDEIALRDNWQLTVGTKIEHNDYTGIEVEPSIRLQWSLAPKQALWTAVSRAVRTPARFDRDLNVVTGLVNAPPPYQFPTDYLDGSDQFTSEQVVAYEAGYRAQLGARTTVSLSLFYNDYTDVRSTDATPTTATYIIPFPVVFGNNLEGESHGFELTAKHQVFPGWRLHAGYTLLRESIRSKAGTVDATGATNETADPEQQWSLRSTVDLPQNLEFDLALRWVDSLVINQSPTSGPVTGIVPSYSELDARLAWHPTPALEVALVGQNLLHDHHPEYGFPSATRVEIQRRVYGKVTWHY
jgi:iron complex outermembrane receptor protein